MKAADRATNPAIKVSRARDKSPVIKDRVKGKDRTAVVLTDRAMDRKAVSMVMQNN